MPSASYSPTRKITEIDQAVAVLRDGGLRVSASRRVVLEGLLQAEGPVSAEYLASGLGGRTSACDLPSAYRNLELFERLGLVRHVHIGHGPGLYALADDSAGAYLVCEHCDQLSRLSAADLEAIRLRIGEQTGFEAHFSHFPIVGLCRRCAARRATRPIKGEAVAHHGDDEAHEHPHDDSHSHEHSHGGETHSHPHDTHEHDHVDHEHEHSHGDHVHSHPHVHQEGLEEEHEHEHSD